MLQQQKIVLIKLLIIFLLEYENSQIIEVLDQDGSEGHVKNYFQIRQHCNFFIENEAATI